MSNPMPDPRPEHREAAERWLCSVGADMGTPASHYKHMLPSLASLLADLTRAVHRRAIERAANVCEEEAERISAVQRTLGELFGFTAKDKADTSAGRCAEAIKALADQYEEE